MKCIQCESDARAVCQFCGRAVCEKHLQQKMFSSGYSSSFGAWSFRRNAVRVEDAVWCGKCHPEHQYTS